MIRVHLVLAGLLAFVPLTVVANGQPTGTAPPAEPPSITMHIDNIEPAVQSVRFDCAFSVTVRNGFSVAIPTFAIELAMRDRTGREVGRKLLELSNLIPNANRIERGGILLPGLAAAGLSCDDLAAADIYLLACGAPQLDMFDACLGSMRQDEASVLDLSFQRAAVRWAWPAPEVPLARRAERVETAAFATIGATLSTITADVAERHGVDAERQGLLVVAVDPDGAAAAHGLEPGDVVVEIDQDEVVEIADAQARLEAASSARRSILLFIDRRGQPRFAVLPLQ